LREELIEKAIDRAEAWSLRIAAEAVSLMAVKAELVRRLAMALVGLLDAQDEVERLETAASLAILRPLDLAASEVVVSRIGELVDSVVATAVRWAHWLERNPSLPVPKPGLAQIYQRFGLKEELKGLI
jgi:hypothetical protein